MRALNLQSQYCGLREKRRTSSYTCVIFYAILPNNTLSGATSSYYRPVSLHVLPLCSACVISTYGLVCIMAHLTLEVILMMPFIAAFRFFRICIKLNNRNLTNHLMKCDIMKPLIDLTVQESRRDNLLSSSCQEFFEHLRRVSTSLLSLTCATNRSE
jgi:hypothetical protein